MTGALLQSVAFQSFAQTSATGILNCTAEGVGVALLAWILLRALGRQNSGMRFAVWFSTLMGIAALPVLGHFGSNGGVVAKSEITIPGSWALYIFAGWLVMALAGLIRVGIGFWHLRQLRKSCTLSDSADLDPVLRKTLKEFDSSRAVAVCVSDRLRVPTAIGFVKPLVVIPGWAMRELSPAELNTILLHELAHLRRWDDWTNLIQKVLGALLFFHPAVWWIEKKLALEREMACDDLVLAQTESPRAYAECLVTLAEKSLLRRGFALAQAAVGRMRHMSLRVAQILDEKRPRATRVWHPAPLFLTGISLASLMMFSGVPRLVSFDNRSAGSGTLSTPMVAPNDSEEDSVSSTQAHIVPAKFEVRPEGKTSASPQANTLAARAVADNDNKVAANSKTKLGKSAVIPAKTTQRPVNPPMLIRSTMSAEQAITPQTLILILQTGRYDAYGAVVWDLSVWRVTVMGPAEPGIVVKSI